METNLNNEVRRQIEGCIAEMLSIIEKAGRASREFLIDYVAKICDVKREDILAVSKREEFAHARWFFWYAYKYMTNENLSKIADATEKLGGYKASRASISDSLRKISDMIESEQIWAQRWSVIRTVINETKKYYLEENKIQSAKDTKQINSKHIITIHVPEEIKEFVKINTTNR